MGLSSEWLLQKRLVGDAKIVFDVGAAIGRVTARYLELFPNATVYAFEPAPANVKKFRARLPKLTGGDRAQVFEAAILDSDGMAVFKLYESNDHHSIFESTEAFQARPRKPGRVVKEVVVECGTLDGFCEHKHIDGHIDVLKIDTEGAEMEVLRGAQGLLENRRIKLIYAELLFWPYRIGQCEPWQVMQFLQERGYFLHSLQAQHHDNEGRLLNADGVFLRV